MRLDLLAGLIAIGLFAGYFVPLLLKLKELPLAIVLVAGFALAIADFIESLRD